MRDWKDWFKKAGIRAIKTIAQAFVAMIGTATYLGAVDWKMVISASLLSGIISIATSLAGIPEETLQLHDEEEGETI